MQTKNDEQNQKTGQQNEKELHTEGPISEKDEVKEAEARTAGRPHDIAQTEKLQDDEGKPVEESEDR